MAGAHVRGGIDMVGARIVELLQAFPYLIFAIAMMAFLGPGFWNLIWALALKGWIEFYRLARGETLAQSNREYVEAARAMGYPTSWILVSESLPSIPAWGETSGLLAMVVMMVARGVTLRRLAVHPAAAHHGLGHETPAPRPHVAVRVFEPELAVL